MIKKIAIAAASLAAISATAFAADIGETSHDWTGFYSGIVGGAMMMDTQASEYNCWIECDIPNSNDFGGFVGGTVGLNYQLESNFVIGLEADITSGIETSKSAFQGDDEESITHSADLNWLATVRGRAGLAVDRTMAYVTAGVAMADADYKVEWGNGGRNGVAAWNDTLYGLTAGAGVEHAFTENLSAKVEYLAIMFEDATDLIEIDVPETCCQVDWSSTVHSVRIGLNYSF